jgi:tetratricopeptide (TPR) repeat protein
LAPDAPGPLAALSHILARLGRHYEAIAAIEAAIERQSDFSPFHVHHGNQLWIVDQFEEADSAYRVAMALNPDDRDAERQWRSLRAAMETMG